MRVCVCLRACVRVCVRVRVVIFCSFRVGQFSGPLHFNTFSASELKLLSPTNQVRPDGSAPAVHLRRKPARLNQEALEVCITSSAHRGGVSADPRPLDASVSPPC